MVFYKEISTIKRASHLDLESFEAIRQSAIVKQCRHHYSEDFLRHWMQQSPTYQICQGEDSKVTYYVDLVNTTVIAFTAVIWHRSLFDGLFVHSDFCGKGIGKSILEFIIKKAVRKNISEL